MTRVSVKSDTSQARGSKGRKKDSANSEGGSELRPPAAIPDGASHARIEQLRREAALVTTRTEREEWLVGLMLAGRFPWGTDKILAPLWGCHEASVRDIAAGARRTYMALIGRLGTQAGEEFKAAILSQLAFIGQDALERREEVVDGMGNVHSVRRPDHRTARQALVDMAELAGFKVQRHEVNVTKLTEEQIRAQLREYGIEVRQIETTGLELPAKGSESEC